MDEIGHLEAIHNDLSAKLRATEAKLAEVRHQRPGVSKTLEERRREDQLLDEILNGGNSYAPGPLERETIEHFDNLTAHASAKAQVMRRQVAAHPRSAAQAVANVRPASAAAGSLEQERIAMAERIATSEFTSECAQGLSAHALCPMRTGSACMHPLPTCTRYALHAAHVWQRSAHSHHDLPSSCGSGLIGMRAASAGGSPTKQRSSSARYNGLAAGNAIELLRKRRAPTLPRSRGRPAWDSSTPLLPPQAWESIPTEREWRRQEHRRQDVNEQQQQNAAVAAVSAGLAFAAPHLRWRKAPAYKKPKAAAATRSPPRPAPTRVSAPAGGASTVIRRPPPAPKAPPSSMVSSQASMGSEAGQISINQTFYNGQLSPRALPMGPSEPPALPLSRAAPKPQPAAKPGSALRRRLPGGERQPAPEHAELSAMRAAVADGPMLPPTLASRLIVLLTKIATPGRGGLPVSEWEVTAMARSDAAKLLELAQSKLGTKPYFGTERTASAIQSNEAIESQLEDLERLLGLGLRSGSRNAHQAGDRQGSPSQPTSPTAPAVPAVPAAPAAPTMAEEPTADKPPGAMATAGAVASGGGSGAAASAPLDAATAALVSAFNTDAGYAELKALFAKLDKDGDGTVNSKEWGSAVSKNKELLSKFFGGASAKEIGQAFKRLDTDGSGDLSWDEFEAGAERLSLMVSPAAEGVYVLEAESAPDTVGEPQPGPVRAPAAPAPSAAPQQLHASSKKDQQPHAPSKKDGEVAPILLMYGGGCDELSGAVASRCGGTLLTLQSLAQIAHAEPSEEGEALLAFVDAGALPAFNVVLPLLCRVVASRNAPFILSGYPRMLGQLKKLEAAVGKLALAVRVGDLDTMDARLGGALLNAGTLTHDCESHSAAAEAVDHVLAAMKGAGVPFTEVVPSSPTPPPLTATSVDEPAPVPGPLPATAPVSTAVPAPARPTLTHSVRITANADGVYQVRIRKGQATEHGQTHETRREPPPAAAMSRAAAAQGNPYSVRIHHGDEGLYQVRIRKGEGGTAAASSSEPAAPAPPAAPQQPHAPSKKDGEVAPILLMYGGGCDELSGAVASRCGGTLLTLQSLAQIAHAEPSEEGEALLAFVDAGALPAFNVVLPLLCRVVASRNAPFILSGYPRMLGQLKKLEAAVGKLALAVRVGDLDTMDARLGGALLNAGTLTHDCESHSAAAEAVDHVLAAMKGAGVPFTEVALPTPSSSLSDSAGCAADKYSVQISRIAEGGAGGFAVKISNPHTRMAATPSHSVRVVSQTDGLRYGVRIQV